MCDTITNLIWTRGYPLPGEATCPVCSASFFQHKSLRAHVLAHYRGSTLSEQWMCSRCKVVYATRQGAANHFAQTHANTLRVEGDVPSPTSTQGEAASTSTTATHICEHCDAQFPTIHGLRNHERARHQAAISASLASREESQPSSPSQAEPCPRSSRPKWTTEEIKRFRTAAQLHGLHSNKILAAAVGSRTSTQVAKFKARYIQQNGQWAYKYMNPPTFGSQRDQATQSSPSTSPASRRSGSSQPPSSLTSETPQLWDTAEADLKLRSPSNATMSPEVAREPNPLLATADNLLLRLRTRVETTPDPEPDVTTPATSKQHPQTQPATPTAPPTSTPNPPPRSASGRRHLSLDEGEPGALTTTAPSDHATQKGFASAALDLPGFATPPPGQVNLSWESLPSQDALPDIGHSTLDLNNLDPIPPPPSFGWEVPTETQPQTPSPRTSPISHRSLHEGSPLLPEIQGRQGVDYALRDYINGYTTTRTQAQSIQSGISAIRQQVETSLAAGLPPPPEPDQGRRGNRTGNNRDLLRGASPKDNSARRKSTTTMGDVNMGRDEHVAPVVPLPRGPMQHGAPPPLTRPTHMGPEGPRGFHGDNQPSINTNRGGWSNGPYRWYGPGWRGIPAYIREQQSNKQREMGQYQSPGWEEWGQGHRGKQREPPNRPLVLNSGGIGDPWGDNKSVGLSIHLPVACTPETGGWELGPGSLGLTLGVGIHQVHVFILCIIRMTPPLTPQPHLLFCPQPHPPI